MKLNFVLLFCKSIFFISLFLMLETRGLEDSGTDSYQYAPFQSVYNRSLKDEKSKFTTTKLICFYVFTTDFKPEIMDGLCTHINVGFFEINEKNYSLLVTPDKEKTLFQILELKNTNDELKILISIGGAGENSFSSMIMNHRTRKQFIKSCMEFLKKFKIDGIDIDWEWPVLSNGNEKEKVKFIQLLREIRKEFDRHKKKYILSVDVASIQAVIELVYYVQYIPKYVDHINVMCYDYHFFTKLFPFTGHNSPLYSVENFPIPPYNINHSISFWLENSVPREKIMLGLPTYGHTFKLTFSNHHSLVAPARGFGSVGQNGFADYKQICDFLRLENTTIVYDNVSKVPYAYLFPEWVSYDDENSLAIKMSGEEMIPCPYNYSHVIMKSRMANHLMKCRQQFPLENYTTCPFNATHDVPVPELKYHVDTCPDRKTMESFLYVIDDQKEEKSTPAKLQVPSLEENWDEDKASGSYLQTKTKVVEEQMIFRPPVGRSKSEKKAFLQSQVKKFQNVDEGNLNVQEHMPGPSRLATEVSDKKESKPLETVSGKVTSDTDSENFKIVMRKSKKSSTSRGMRLKETH